MSEFVAAEQIALMGIALAIGLLIGIERGWEKRDTKEGGRIAGLRTYGLTGLLGGGTGVLSQHLEISVFGFVFLGFAAAVTVAYVIQRRFSDDASITSIITMLLTFVLGALATLNMAELAVSSAVVTAILLRYKEALHGWLKTLEEKELRAALQLLLISVVLLPILPDQGYGPWESFNPYEIWWMVVLIASISFVGYFTVKIAGAGKGMMLTALAAGMASSTALTLHYSRLSREQKEVENLLAAGILLACGTMFPRMLLVASLINMALFKQLVTPMAVMTVICLLSAAMIWRRAEHQPEGEFTQLINPLELRPALFFGLVLMLIIFLGNAAVHYFGATGLYVLATLSGVADVDSINLTLARMSKETLALDVAVLAIVLAAATNTVVKAVMALSVGTTSMGVKVLLPLLLAAVAGLSMAWLF